MNPFRRSLRDHVLPVCIVAMWAGMFWSRALLSMGLIAFVTAALLYSGPAAAWRVVKQDKGLWGLLLLFTIPLLGFPWSDDKHAWLEAMVLKAPFLAWPFTLAALRETPRERLRFAGRVIVLITLVSGLIVLGEYMMDVAEVNASYLRGAVMRVPMDNDHVRYGWALSLVYLIVLVDRSGADGQVLALKRWTSGAMLILLGGFILLLSSRTGIIGFLVANILVLSLTNDRKQRVTLLASLIVVPLLAWAIFPSLQNRVRFMVWDFQNYSRGSYREGLNDGPRVTSWQAALDLIRERPWTGSGFGGIRPRMQEWYALNRPAMPLNERLVPSNEWLFHGAASGIPGMILFTIAIALAFRRRTGGRTWKMVWCISAIGFLYETGLEVQHGIHLFAFFMIWLAAGEGGEPTE